MTVLNQTDPSNGTVADAGLIAANYALLKAVINGGLDNSNVAGGAAIALAKLALGNGSQFSRSASPPGSPADLDLWECVVDATAGIKWLFRYNAGSASAFKWEFLGGSALVVHDPTAHLYPDAGYADVLTLSTTWPRNGDYEVTWGAWTDNSSGNGQTFLALVNNGGIVEEFSAVANGVRAVLESVSVVTGAVAAQTVKLQQHTNGGVPALYVEKAKLVIRPRRVS